MISIFNVIFGCVKVGREYSATSFLTLAQLTHISGKISHGRRCSGIHSNNEFTAGSWCCTESERSRCRTCCSLALNQFHLHQKVRNKMCRFSAIQAHTARPSFQVQSGCGTLCQWTSASYLLTVSRPTYTVSSSTHHRTLSCFYLSALYCFYPKLLAVVCCTTFLVHTCLLTRSAILLEFESLLLPEKGPCEPYSHDDSYRQWTIYCK